MEENKSLELVKEERGISLIAPAPYEVNNSFKKTRTIQSDELNFYSLEYDEVRNGITTK